MRWSAMGGALGLGLAALVLSGAVEEARGQNKRKDAPGWLNDLGAAQTAARQSGKPIMLAFR
ncbi:MAG: hypothetical protein JNM56_07325 [Planctomycetia bacterium]|nr:hypothetical protein [Planctomycetia bacterium]